MKFLICVLVCLFPFLLQASSLYYADKKGELTKDEDIVSVLVSGGKQSEVSIHTQSMDCHIRTNNVEEAYKIQDTLLKDRDSWVQCHGERKKPNSPDSIFLETKEYSLGRKLEESPKQMI